MTRPRPLATRPAGRTRRGTLYLACLTGLLFGLAMAFGFFSAFVSGDGGAVGGPAALGVVVLGLATLAGLILCIGLFLRRNAPDLPSGTTFATRREAWRVVRRRRPSGDPLTDEVARMTAQGTLGHSPWTTMRIPLLVFVLGFGLNVAEVAVHFAALSASPGLPWGHLAGTVFFLFMAVVHPSVAAAQREDAHAFLNALDRAERERSTPGADL